MIGRWQSIMEGGSVCNEKAAFFDFLTKAQCGRMGTKKVKAEHPRITGSIRIPIRIPIRISIRKTN